MTLVCKIHGPRDVRLEYDDECALASYEVELRFWVVPFLRTRRVDVRPLMSAQLPLDRAAEAFELAADRQRSTKVQLVCEP